MVRRVVAIGLRIKGSEMLMPVQRPQKPKTIISQRDIDVEGKSVLMETGSSLNQAEPRRPLELNLYSTEVSPIVQVVYTG